VSTALRIRARKGRRLNAGLNRACRGACGPEVTGHVGTLADQPFGPILLILVALGLVAFGLLSFFEAKWRRTYGGVPV